ncbi:MAG: hypothetical protein PUF16_03405 [Lachnospiraceae bacterium]|nr:hypothetical protein [Lachnospiraceae bacterium]
MDSMTINGRECHIYENGDAEYVLLQPVDDNDISVLDSEAQKISELTDVPLSCTLLLTN